MHARVYAAQKCRNLIVYSLASHKDAVVAVFFEHSSLDVTLLTFFPFISVRVFVLRDANK